MVNFTEAWGLTLEVVSVQWRFAQGLDFNSWLWELSAHWVALSRYENSDWSCMHSSNFSSITPTVLDIMEKMWYPIGLTSLMDGHQLSSLKLKLVSTISCWPLWITFFFKWWAVDIHAYNQPSTKAWAFPPLPLPQLHICPATVLKSTRTALKITQRIE